MDKNGTNPKNGKTEESTSYCNMSLVDAEKRLGVRLDKVDVIPVDHMLERMGSYPGLPDIKKAVYDHIVEYIRAEGYPMEGSSNLTAGNIGDLVYAIINPILVGFKRNTKKTVQLHRRREFVAVNNEADGREEHLVMDLITVDEKLIVIVGGKISFLEQAMKQCLLSMMDHYDTEKTHCAAYGFVTTGERWGMFEYDGRFYTTDKMGVLFNTMVAYMVEGEEEEVYGLDGGETKYRWMEECSILVECIYAALNFPNN